MDEQTDSIANTVSRASWTFGRMGLKINVERSRGYDLVATKLDITVSCMAKYHIGMARERDHLNDPFNNARYVETVSECRCCIMTLYVLSLSIEMRNAVS